MQEKNMIFQLKKQCFLMSNGSNLGAKLSQNSVKHRVHDAMHVGIDFCSISVDLGCQVGLENLANIHPNTNRKDDAKKEIRSHPRPFFLDLATLTIVRILQCFKQFSLLSLFTFLPKTDQKFD